MPGKPKYYTPEFKEQAVRRVVDSSPPQARRLFTEGCPRLPLAMFEEIHPPAPRWPDAPAAYLQLSETYEDQAARARELGWPVAQLVSHHLALLTEPGLVARSVHELLGLLGQ